MSRDKAEDADGRENQRSGRALAKHDRRDGEGLQRLRQSGDGLARIQQDDQSGGRERGGRAKATQRSHGKVSRLDEPSEPGSDGQHGRAVAVNRGPAQRDKSNAAPGPRQYRLAQARFAGNAASATNQ